MIGWKGKLRFIALVDWLLNNGTDTNYFTKYFTNY